MSSPARTQPNILITGTPGCGKTTTSEAVASSSGLKHINVGEIVRSKALHEGWDETYESHILDDDKLLDELEDIMTAGGNIVDFHTCDVFPERWFDLVVVLRTDNQHLYDRLQSRGYNEKKIEENMECEIMQVVLEEARESYAKEVVVELQSDNVTDMESNVDRIQEWIDNYVSDNA